MQEQEFAAVIRQLGGKVYIAGGWVRDWLRGAVPKDKDYVVAGLAEEEFMQAFPRAEKVGKGFPVYLLKIDEEYCEVAFARREKKSGRGYKGFTILADKTISIEEDLYRRDTTINSMALELPEGQLIDPWQGQRDLAQKQIVHTSCHFKDDPIRALRAARQAAQLGFTVAPETVALMSECSDELREEPKERLFNELVKALSANRPSMFFTVLAQAGLLQIAYPQLYALQGQTQPAEYHPEGDAFVHSMLVVDEAARRSPCLEVRFAALVHDLGKGLTPKDELPHHYGHEERGIKALQDFNRHITLPQKWRKAAEFAIRHHMRAGLMRQPGKIVDLMLELYKNPLGWQGFSAILAADGGSVPDYLQHFEEDMAAFLTIKGHEAPLHLQGAKIADWLRQQRIAVYCHREKQRHRGKADECEVKSSEGTAN